MATLDRIQPAYTPWTPSSAGLALEDEDYIGKHRRPGLRWFSMVAMFYSPKHRRRH
jgi:hypothetical protein